MANQLLEFLQRKAPDSPRLGREGARQVTNAILGSFEIR
jgi:hypothetical protein